MTRGSTSTSTAFMPSVSSASISSLTFIVPIWAVKAEPERPATMIAAMRTPSSRRIETASRLTVNTSAPNLRSWSAPWKAKTTPIRKDSRPRIGSAFSPVSSIWWISAATRSRRGCRMVATVS